MSFATGSSALGCFTGGLTWYDLVGGRHQRLEEFRRDACKDIADVHYTRTLERIRCIEDIETHNHVILSIRRFTSDDGAYYRYLEEETCLKYMREEMNARDHGSLQDHGHFRYKDDPDAGPCRWPTVQPSDANANGTDEVDYQIIKIGGTAGDNTTVAAAGFSTSQDYLGKIKRLLGLG